MIELKAKLNFLRSHLGIELAPDIKEALIRRIEKTEKAIRILELVFE